MQALVLDNRLSYRQDVSKPVLGDNDALVKLCQAGICAMDLELVKGYAGLSGVIGHEFLGVVEAVVNPEQRHWLDQRVVGSIKRRHCSS